MLLWIAVRNIVLCRIFYRLRGRRSWLLSKYGGDCTWADGADVTLEFDKSVHLQFGLTSVEARQLAAQLEMKARQAEELEAALAEYNKV